MLEYSLNCVILRMRLLNHHFLRILVAMLVTVFVTNTVYAGNMMVSASGKLAMSAAVETQMMAEDVMAHHCHDQAGAAQSDSEHQSPSHSGSHCHHCMACYSVILDSQLDVAAVRSQPVLAVAANVLYLAPVTPQPSKPPII